MSEMEGKYSVESFKEGCEGAGQETMRAMRLRTCRRSNLSRWA